MAPTVGSRPKPRRRALRAWTLGLIPVAVIVLALLGAAARRVVSPGVGPDARPGPVLLVSGYGGSVQSLDALAARVRAAGRVAVVVPPVGDNTGDLRTQARSLQAVAREQLAAGAPSVDVVGYSAGGVVVRLWMADFGGGGVTRRAVTLGSPHHGTQLAALGAGLLGAGCPVACQQLAPDSDVLAGLPDTPSGPAWTSIWTADDDVVTPPTSAELAGALDIELQQICPSDQVSHDQLPSSPLTLGLVVAALTGAPLRSVPGADQCAALTRSGSQG